MKEFKVKLCGSGCGSGCPDVEFTGTAVRIGEDENSVRLTPAEWNLLVEKIRAGELDTIS